MRKFLCIALALGLEISCAENLVNATSEVSLRDKIGQMLLIGFDGKKINAHSQIVKTIEKDNIGGVILFDYDSAPRLMIKILKALHK